MINDNKTKEEYEMIKIFNDSLIEKDLQKFHPLSKDERITNILSETLKSKIDEKEIIEQKI